MIRTSSLWSALALSLLAASVGAQNAQPKLEKIEEGAGSPITVTPKTDNEKKKITQKREQGKVTEVKVKSGKSSYTLKPNTPAGSSLPGDATGSANRGPQWQVMEFDLGKKTKQQKEAEAAASAPPPPEPAAPR